MGKYYFVHFMYGASEKSHYNTVTKTHNLQLQIECDKSYPGQYVITNWVEIDVLTYDKYEPYFYNKL